MHVVSVVAAGVGRDSKKPRRRRGKSQAAQWLETLWALFSFLECGSPSSSHAVQKVMLKLERSQWTHVHRGHAANLFKQTATYCRVSDPESNSRGVKGLEQVINATAGASYDSLPTLSADALTKQAACQSRSHVIAGASWADLAT